MQTQTSLSVGRDHFGGSYFLRKGTRLLCSDGVIRCAAYLAQQADTFFSIPAAIRLRGKYVRGYATEEQNESGQRAFVFRHLVMHGKDLPAWPDVFTSEHNSLIAKGGVL